MAPGTLLNKRRVFLLTKGDGSDGDEWCLISIHSSRELAEVAQADFSTPRERPDGSTHSMYAQIEEWEVDPS